MMSRNGRTSGLSVEEIEILRQATRKELDERPPTIGMIGVSGVGKSSTINALFKTNFATSDTVACTKEFQYKDVELTFMSGEAKGSQALVRVVDAPGLGEHLAKDPEYLARYREHLPRCDVIIWVLAARNRGLALDQLYLRELQSFHGRMVFGLNQVDLTEPMNWHPVANGPSPEQESNLKRILEDRTDKLQQVLGRPITIVPYSAKSKYNLQTFFTSIVEACPDDRRWIFSSLKAFRADDFLTTEARQQLDRHASRSPLSWVDRFFGAFTPVTPDPRETGPR
jgi:predicted GTPase